MSGRTCVDCPAWNRLDGLLPTGECRCNPPVIVATPQSFTTTGWFPKTDADDWCLTGRNIMAKAKGA